MLVDLLAVSWHCKLWQTLQATKEHKDSFLHEKESLDGGKLAQARFAKAGYEHLVSFCNCMQESLIDVVVHMSPYDLLGSWCNGWLFIDLMLKGKAFLCD